MMFQPESSGRNFEPVEERTMRVPVASPRQCKSLWHVGLRAVRKALISDPIWDLTLFLQSRELA